jgi:hypothetical protein
MTSQPDYVDRISHALSTATPADISAGREWYAEARAIAQRGAEAYGTTLEHAAVALAHLSPQCSWELNVRAFERLLCGDGKREPGVIGTSFARARASLAAADPWSTFGRRANKTRSFARNICGDPEAVTVDTHVARVVGIRSRAVFDRPRVYADIVDSYREVAEHDGRFTPAELQAITWVQAKDGRVAA